MFAVLLWLRYKCLSRELCARLMPAHLQIEFSLKWLGTMVTTSQVEPRQNSVKCPSSASRTRSPSTYVPFAEFRSHSRTVSRVTPTTQCKAETCWSSISMSAPPPVRPMLVLALVSWYAWPFNGPVMTETVMVLFLRADGSMSEGNTPKGRRLWDESTVPTVGKQQAVSKTWQWEWCIVRSVL